MVQQTSADMEYANHKRATLREAFLEATESIIPFVYGDSGYINVKKRTEMLYACLGRRL